MFRYAAEPFYFNYYKSKDDKEVFSGIMRLFIASMLIISMFIIFYLKYIKYFIDTKFHEGLRIVPLILTAYIFYGVFFNLSIWYKLKKKTIFGALLTITGALITIGVNVLFVRKYSYVASSYGHIAAYSTMVILSYIIGRKYFPINYNLKRIAEYLIVAILIFTAEKYLIKDLNFLSDLIKGLLIVAYALYILYREKMIKHKFVFQ